MSSILGNGKAGTKARRCEAAGSIHGTAILSLKVVCEEGMFRGEMRMRSQGSVCHAKPWPLSDTHGEAFDGLSRKDDVVRWARLQVAVAAVCG